MWKYSEDEALCLLIDAQLSKRQYTTIRLQAKAKGADIYPAYKNVRAAKERCYPDPVTATESGCEVGLQAILDLTARRLLLVQKAVLGTVVTYDSEMRRLLVTMDPVISAMRCLPNLKKRSLMHEVLQLLDSPSISAPSMERESSGEEEIDSL